MLSRIFRSRQGSDSQPSSTVDFAEGPFSNYMTQGPWQLNQVVGDRARGMQPHGEDGGTIQQHTIIGQRSPEVLQDINNGKLV